MRSDQHDPTRLREKRLRPESFGPGSEDSDYFFAAFFLAFFLVVFFAAFFAFFFAMMRSPRFFSDDRKMLRASERRALDEPFELCIGHTGRRP